MANRNWTNASLDVLRLQGDPQVDALVESVLAPQDAGQTGGRTGYNFMLDLADQLRANPSLALGGCPRKPQLSRR